MCVDTHTLLQGKLFTRKSKSRCLPMFVTNEDKALLLYIDVS